MKSPSILKAMLALLVAAGLLEAAPANRVSQASGELRQSRRPDPEAVDVPAVSAGIVIVVVASDSQYGLFAEQL
jgi:hypothetical protein